jgi:hypothetical protein
VSAEFLKRNQNQTPEESLDALEAAALNPEVPKFNPGVLQT